MSNHNSFLAVALDDSLLQSVDNAARALQASPSELLHMSSGVGFDPVRTDALHMTFLFFGEHLRNLPTAELHSLHTAVQALVQAAATAEAGGPTAPLAFRGFELFPPGKNNLVVARFESTPELLRLRTAILAACHEHAVSMPASYFSLIEGEGAWSPHVTLGKIRASREELGRASCGGTGLRALAPTGPLRPVGLTLLGARPPRATWGDWEDAALAFGPALAGEADDALRPTPGTHAGEMLAWVADLLEDAQRLNELSRSKFHDFDQDANGPLEWPEFAALSRDLAATLGVPAPQDDKLRPAFSACAKGHGGAALSMGDFSRFLRGFLRSSLEHLRQIVEHPLFQSPVQPAHGPGRGLTPELLKDRWASLTWPHKVVEFKGREERQNATELRCFSNFYDEIPFDFEIPAELCAPSLQLNDADRVVRCNFSEKAIMICKAAAMADREGFAAISRSQTPHEAKQLGRQIENWRQDLWDHLVSSVAYEVVYQKFHKLSALQPVLLGTGDCLIVEATRADSVWGIGMDKGNPKIQYPSEWRGSNVLGWALMEVRTALRSQGAS